MVFTVEDINSSLFPSQKSFTPNESYRDHSFYLNSTDLRNEKVEQLYGPFETKTFGVNYSSPRPKPLSRNEEKASTFENMTLEQLKKMIADREALKAKQTNILDNEFNSTKSKVLVKSPRLKFKQPPIIVIDDSSDNMDIGSDTDSVILNETSLAMSSEHDKDADEDQMNTESESTREKDKDTEDNMEMDEVTSKDDSASEDSYATATDQLMEEQDLLEEQTLNDEEAMLLTKLQESQNSVKNIQVELLGMKVRMSLNKNKNDTKKKVSPVAPLPQLGSKRATSTSHTDNTSASHKKLKRKTEEIYRRQGIPGYGYSTPIPHPPPFYQQLPTQNTYNTYVPPPQPFFTSRQSPPPPPPATRPVTPPPPPPPSVSSVPINIASNYRQNDHLPKPRPHISEEKSDVESMKDAIQVENTLKDIEQLVSQRIFNDTTSHTKVESRRSPRPVRLVTVDNYTMPMHMLLLDEDKSMKWEPPTTKFVLPAGVPVETEMVDSWYESPLFVMLRRKATGQPFNSIIAPVVQEIIDAIPPTDNLESVKIGDLYFVNLEKALHIARTHAYRDPANEFLAALRLELSFYVYGNTKMFHDDYKEIVAHIPLSVDIEWQRIRAEATFSSQLPLILDLLHRISLRHTSFAAKESIPLSSMTVEVLIRLLRLNGSKQVWQLLTNFDGIIDSDKGVILDMDDAPGLHLQESDKYGIWMLVLFQLMSKKLPEVICSAWMNSFVKDGSPTKALSLFMVDWSTSDLSEYPLDRSTLCGATNILLSLLRHFGKKACNDVRRKPLLVGVLRTFSSFLSCNPSYRNAGTLLLVRKMASLTEQIPEIQEMIIELEIKVGSAGTNIVDHVYSSKGFMSTSNIYSLTYHVARYYFEGHTFNKQLLLVISNILLYPLLERNTKKIQLQIMGQLTTPAPSTLTQENLILLVDTIRQRYLTAMGLDSLMASNKMHRSSDQKNLCKVPFAWINLLLLTAISKYLYPETSIIKDSLTKNLKIIFEEGMKKVDSDDGKLVLFKYGQQLRLI